jgi:chemotaxis response regulator CheB
VIGVNNAFNAVNVIHRITPDLVRLDVSMPSGNEWVAGETPQNRS